MLLCPRTAHAVINADEPWTELWAGVNRAGHVLTFGSGPGCDVRVTGDEQQPVLRTPQGAFDLRLALPGAHNRLNAAAATAVALALDIGLDDIRAGLEGVKPVPGRLNFIETSTGWTVIDDTYNANPASLYSALQVLSGMQGTPWLVLGDMKELGDRQSQNAPRSRRRRPGHGRQRLFATGEMSRSRDRCVRRGW